MTGLTKSFQLVTKELKNRKVQFIVAGGLAASLYREQPRLTDDIDLAVAFSVPVMELEEFLVTLNLSVTRFTEAELKGGPKQLIASKKSPISIVSGRATNQIGIDFLLPHLPWVSMALKRGESHQVDFGFGALATITVEDLLLAKFYAVTCRNLRYKDLDDIQSILKTQNELDLAYLVGQMRALKIPAPLQIVELPDIVRQISHEIVRRK